MFFEKYCRLSFEILGQLETDLKKLEHNSKLNRTKKPSKELDL